MDYRIDRWGGCKAYHVTAMRMGDVDPSAPMLQFIAKRLNLTLNQKFWLAWLYSTCYSVPAAFYMLCNLDRNLTQSDVVLWWKSHKEKMKFGNDRIYVKNRDEFPKMYETYKRFMFSGEYRTFSRYRKANPTETYNALFNALNGKLWYFSRYSLFTYMEAVYNLTKFPMKPLTIELKEARTTRNGICFAVGKDEWVRSKHQPAKLTAAQYVFLQGKFRKLYYELCSEHPEIRTTYWNLETSMCAYYKIHNKRRYAGYYIDRQMTDIQEAQKLAPAGANWDLLWEFRKGYFHPKTLGEVMGYSGIRHEMMDYFQRTGRYTEEPITIQEA